MRIPSGQDSRRGDVAAAVWLFLVLCMAVSAAPAFANGTKPLLKASATDDSLPGVPIPPSPFSDSVDEVSDPDDVFSVALQPGQTLQVTVQLTSGTGDLDVALYPPGTTSIEGLENAVAVSRNEGRASESANYTVPAGAGGVYYLDIYSYEGASGYTLTWSVTGLEPALDEVRLGISVGPSVVAYRGTVTIRGKLTDAQGSALGGRTLQLQRSIDGETWRLHGSYRPVSGNNYAVKVQLSRRTYFRWRFAGDSRYDVATSRRVYATSKASLTPPSYPSVVRYGRTINFGGYLKPQHSGGTVRVTLQYYRGGRWVDLNPITCTVSTYSSYSRYRGVDRFSGNGRFKVRARAYFKDADHAATYSAWRYFTVQ
jgi:hypothetical protein